MLRSLKYVFLATGMAACGGMVEDPSLSEAATVKNAKASPVHGGSIINAPPPVGTNPNQLVNPQSIGALGINVVPAVHDPNTFSAAAYVTPPLDPSDPHQ